MFPETELDGTLELVAAVRSSPGPPAARGWLSLPLCMTLPPLQSCSLLRVSVNEPSIVLQTFSQKTERNYVHDCLS